MSTTSLIDDPWSGSPPNWTKTMRAASIYQHATDDRDQEIARELSRRAEQAAHGGPKPLTKIIGRIVQSG